MTRYTVIIIFSLLSPIYGWTQTADFIVPATVCKNEQILLSNNSSATTYLWDFCNDGLLHAGAETLSANVASNIPVGMEVVYDKGNWFGWVCSREGTSNELIRMSFGNSLSNTSTQLPDFSAGINGNLSGVSEIKFIHVNNNWFGFVANYYSNNLIRLDFGNLISNNNPTLLNLGNPGGWNGFYGLDILEDNGNYTLAATGNSSNTISFIDYGTTLIAATPAVTSVNTISASSFSLLNTPVKIGLQSQGGKLFALISSLAGHAVLMDMGISFMNAPTNVASVAAISSASALQFKSDGNRFVAFIQNNSGNLYRLHFGNAINFSPQVDFVGTYSGGGIVYGLSVVKENTEWMALYAGVLSNNVHRLKFHDQCAGVASLISSSEFEPAGLSYSTAGTYPIELTAFDISLNRSIASQDILVQDQTAPEINFSIDSQCVTVASNFTGLVLTGGPVSTWSWNFGDTFTATGTMASHSFGATGNYMVSVKATSQFGCTNQITKSVSIFNPPTADFNLPTGTLCTGQQLSFINTSAFDGGSNPSWQWNVDNSILSTDQNPLLTFQTTGNHTIELLASIPGCSNTKTSIINIASTGPSVDFNFSSQCFGQPTNFQNLTSGQVSNYVWNFGDGSTTGSTSTTHVFGSLGNHTVSLLASNAQGCQTTVEKIVPIYDNPQPDFFIDLPPFSCTGSPTQFHDGTPAPTGSNIAQWTWSFNDGVGSSASVKDPQHTFASPGFYDVTLSVTTNFGCQAAVQIPIEIQQSPIVDFSVSAACINKGTQFRALTSGGMRSWNWTIGNTFYGFPDPTHTFTLVGDYQATLVAVANNNCEALVSKTIQIKPVPLLDFSTSVACVGQETIFTDQTTGIDLPQQWLWNFGLDSYAEDSPASHAFSEPGAKPVQMTVTTQGGCEYSLTKNVVVSPSPIASFTTSTEYGPPPLLTQFTNTSVNASSQSWNFGFNNATSALPNPTFTFPQLGDYLVELTATNGAGCTDVFTKIINVLIPTRNLTLEQLEIQVGFSSDVKIPVVTVKNNSNVFVSTANALVTGSSGLRVKSTIALNLEPGAAEEFILPLEIFTTEEFLCVEIDAATDVDLSDNSQCKNLLGRPVLMQPYPNPTSGVLWFDAVLDEAARGSIIISDGMGKKVFAQEFDNLQQGMNRLEVDFTNQPAGLYFAIWKVNNKQTEFRFIR
jgi:PKD repeat protein